MRITGGTHGGRILQSPKDRSIRPTSDKVRLAIFNMLNARGLVAEAVILDAFCGTGALGLEALSQGAASAIFMDKNKSSLDLARQNYTALAMGGGHFILKDATKPAVKPETVPTATLVFLDPPYHQSLLPPAIQGLCDGEWISNDAHIVIESETSFDPGLLAPFGCEMMWMRDYGDTRVALLGRVIS